MTRCQIKRIPNGNGKDKSQSRQFSQQQRETHFVDILLVEANCHEIDHLDRHKPCQQHHESDTAEYD
eukprot:CAMPEP_0197059860 /NCGR_PEP_ID=MMETSP1384-20130603/121799_1 /TAXON_ID=29189 /ORGANISM="Ammonia sp." /LENGTH=66 /DNA_ID=CAMNT_0042495057 /DNA_START=38 /DNA_END=235 /DNA_ORIENTATION=-